MKNIGPNLGEVDIANTDWVQYYIDPNKSLGAHYHWPTLQEQLLEENEDEEQDFPFYVESNRPVQMVSKEEIINTCHLDPNLPSLQENMRIITDNEMAEFRKRRF